MPQGAEVRVPLPAQWYNILIMEPKKEDFFPSVYRVVIPIFGGGNLELKRRGETWEHPDIEAINKRLREKKVRYEFESPYLEGAPGSSETFYKDGTKREVIDYRDSREEWVSFPGEAPVCIWISRRVDERV